MHGPIRHHRTLFLSDLHLGAIGGRSDLILAFLRQNRAETYYLVGDILDLWQPLLPHWTADDQGVLEHLKARIAEGAAVHYLRGNHDPRPETAPPDQRLDLTVHDSLIYQAADGRRFLVLHGDVADGRIFRSHLMTRLGSRLDHGLRQVNRVLARLWRGSGDARMTVELVIAWINRMAYRGRQHEEKLVARARALGLDGVICGHFHISALHDDHGLIYANCGDWVDSMTALAETADGTLRLLAQVPLPKIQPQTEISFPLEPAR